MKMNGKVLVVEDDRLNRQFLVEYVEAIGHTAIAAENGKRALDLMRSERPDVVLLDMIMPEMNGDEVLGAMKSAADLRDIPVIMISAVNEAGTVLSCIQKGADDYLTKPFDGDLLKARISGCLAKKLLLDERERYRRELESYNLTLEDRVREQVREISLAQMATIFAMAKITESRDEDTGEHLERMREYAKIIAADLHRRGKCGNQIDSTFIMNLYAASPLHDIGKVAIPDRVLLKPGKLTPEEFETVKLHTTIGADTLRGIKEQYPSNQFVNMGIEIAESHHEKWDGTGYPKGLAGEDIPHAGRIVALGDVYDALTAKRCYKAAISHEEARDIITAGRGRHFDPDVVDSFVSLEDRFLEIRRVFRDAPKKAIAYLP
jgi:putative two-component system response regulator